jgi:hypothetical protein
LLEWLTGELMARFSMPDALARGLVATGRILPILDGLDEMDPEQGDPVRALAAVSRINNEGGVKW